MSLSLLETSSKIEKLMLIFAVVELSLLLQLPSMCVGRGIYYISPDFAILKTYLWSVCFFLDSNFAHSLLFAWKILNFCGFCSWLWNAMSKLNLWLCIVCFQCDCRCIGLLFSSMNGQGEFKFHNLWDWKLERVWVQINLLCNTVTCMVIVIISIFYGLINLFDAVIV